MKKVAKERSRFVITAWNIAGIILVAIGVIGIFVPLLPTTEFLILASLCFAHGSPRFRKWLYNNKILGVYLKNYTKRKGITMNSKIITLAALWISIGYLLYTLHSMPVKAVLVMILAGVTWHIATIKTLK